MRMKKVNVAVLPVHNEKLNEIVASRTKDGNLNNTKTRVIAELIDKAYNREVKK